MQLQFGDEGFGQGSFEQIGNVAEARAVVNGWLALHLSDRRFVAGFPERDDRIRRWRVPVMLELGGEAHGPVGELTLDWSSGAVSSYTELALFTARAVQLEQGGANLPVPCSRASAMRHPFR